MITIQRGSGQRLPFIDVRDFGAVGDGGTDDTAAIQSAISSASVGQSVLIPYGTWKITGTLTITKSIILTGEGRSVTVLQGTHNGPMITIDATSGAIYYGSIMDMRVENTNGGTSVVGIRLTGTGTVNYSRFDNIQLRGCYTGYLNEITAENYGSNTLSNLFMDNYASFTTFYGIRYTGGHTVGEIVCGCHINVAATGFGFHMVDYAAGTVGVGDILISGNYFNGGANSIYLKGSNTKYTANFRVVGNSCMDTSSYPIELDTITGSTFLGNVVDPAVGSTVVFQGANCTGNIVDALHGGITAHGAIRSVSLLEYLGDLNSGWKLSDGTIVGIGFISSTLTRSLAIGTTSNHPLIFGTNNTFPAMTIDTSQRVGIGETSLANLLTIGANSDTTNINTRINGATSTGSSVGTLTNAPSAGNPVGYLSVNVNGTERKIPYW